MNIVLVGPMGSGKTSVGRYLANVLRRDFFDSDEQIVASAGVDIGSIFDIEGEQGFRKWETQILLDLCKKNNIILATGGGCVIIAENRKILNNSNNFIIYLFSSIKQLVERTANSKTRPLLDVSSDREKVIADLLVLREPFYKKIADASIDTTGKKFYNIVDEIKKIISK